MTKKLYRSPKDGLVFGVCSGVAHFLKVDVVVVRIVVLVVAVLTNPWATLLVYVLAGLVMPVDPSQDTVPSNQHPKDVTPK